MKCKKHEGFTYLLNEPKTADRKKFPNAFDSDIPDEYFTSYRLVASSDPTALTDAVLAEMLKASKHGKLMADLETIEGRTLCWITIYPDSSNGTSEGQRGQFEPGPRLEKTMTKAVTTEGKSPEPPGMGFF